MLWGAVLAMGFCTPAHAGEVWGTRGGEEMVEKAHHVDVKLDHGHARLVVRRTLRNQGSEIDEATFRIDVPADGVAIGLRTLGKRRGQPWWYEGDLMDSDRAAKLYRKLTGIGPHIPKDPALLYWTSPRTLALQVFPILPSTEKTIEYTYVVSMGYRNGRYHLHLPMLGTAAMPARYRVEAADRADSIVVDGSKVENGHRLIPTADDGEGFDVELEPFSSQTLAGSFASVSAGSRRLVHFDLAAAPRLSELPVEAQVVVVLDASRSVDEGTAQAQHAAAIAALSHLEDAAVSIVHFDRDVRERDPQFMDTDTAIKKLAEGPPEADNGSAVDVALQRADALLGTRPRELPRRIVVLSDLRTRERLADRKIQRLGLVNGAIVHVATVVPGEVDVDRADQGPWATLASRTGGVRWMASADRMKPLSDDMKRIYEEWARPVRIDAVTIDAGANLDVAPTSLREGEGMSHNELVKGSVGNLRIVGKLWSAPVQKTLSPTREANKRWAALAFSNGLRWVMTDKEQARLARKGGAVSPVTSYIAIEPGVRPSSAGFDWAEGRGFGGRAARLPRVRTARAMLGGGSFSPASYLKALLTDAFDKCGGEHQIADVDIETTNREIVDVAGISIEASDDEDLKRCLEEAAWDIDLPPPFESINHRVFALNVNW